MQVEPQVLEAVLDSFALSFPHEPVVYVHCNDPVRAQGSQQQSSAHCTVHTTTHQTLGREKGVSTNQKQNTMFSKVCQHNLPRSTERGV